MNFLSYFIDKPFTENRLMADIRSRLAPIRAEEAEAKAMAASAKRVFGNDALVRTSSPLAASQAEDVKFKAEGESFIGTLTIHSTTHGKNTFAAGHSWIELTDKSGESSTLGTWGNNPLQLKDGDPLMGLAENRQDFYPDAAADATAKIGLFQGLEAARHPVAEASRSVQLTPIAARKLNAVVEAFESRGDKAWTYATPCSAFASICWEATTGEKLADEGAVLSISTPHTLRDSILHANGDAKEGVLVIGGK